MRESSAPENLAYTYPRRWLSLMLVIATSSVIAVLIALMERDLSALPVEMLVSNGVGLSIFLLIQSMLVLGRGRVGILPAVLVAVPLGILVGGKIVAWCGGPDIIGHWLHDPVHGLQSIGVTLLFAVSATAFIVVFVFAANYRVELETERRRGAEVRRSQAVAELALLQAQIEPHFLFNTLAHVQSAIEQEPAVGKLMLEHLIRYLRGTLQRSRALSYALADERELIESLLAIAALRLGKRLRYAISMDEALDGAPLPPLLLQPLVENAIKHGIEPALEGGDIHIEARRDGDLLILRVTDNGVGIAPSAPEGVGLSNVRARLLSLYGERGRVSLKEHAPRGTVAELLLPLA